MWDKRVVEAIEECIGDYSVVTLFKNVDDGWEWAFAGSYGPNVDRDRRRLWEELAGLYSLWDVPWCMGGDYNITHFPSERSGHYRNSVAMEDFSKFIFELDLMDLPLVGGEYTWSNGRAWSRLDRFLVSPSWEAHYPEVSQKRLAQVSSDHFPIFLDCEGIHRGRRYFKFKNMWLTADGFVEMVSAWWSSYQFNGTPSFILASKLKALKQDLKKWNLEVFGHIDNQKSTLLEELQELEGKELLGDTLEEVLLRKGTVMANLERVLSSEEISWRQKSRALWLKKGDRCTKFFHKVANSHRRNNAIESLQFGSQVVFFSGTRKPYCTLL
ncbi:uncharacterized protein LOC121247439 [Juglans microcarpa x Juglans regia]|uniref:uncharacterized protein LOC121247439 n=1 Tax=Juglans microcarpa x Juglans regia TaxID=2249226 RepID=UPI001B7E7996|nr:uncharacterized protein LOC121247439 [Juglans microcarpa x Juglans regia]